MLTVKPSFARIFPVSGRPPIDDSALTLAVAAFLQTRGSANTRAAYRADLRHFAAWCGNGQALNLLNVDGADLARYRAACETDRTSAATLARRLSAIMSFSAYAAEHGLEPVLADADPVARPTLATSSTAAVLSDADADALLHAADRNSPRDGVLVRLLMLEGLKVGEVVRADAADVRGRAPRLSLAIDGRDTPALALHAGTVGALQRYLGSRRTGPLLQSEQRGVSSKRLTRFGVDYIVKQITQAAGLSGSISGNTLRRRFVIAAHESGTDMETIRSNAGHAAERTTRRYLADHA